MIDQFEHSCIINHLIVECVTEDEINNQNRD